MPEAVACDQGSREYGADRRADAAGHHATCLMTFHPGRREARSQEPARGGHRVQHKAEKQSDALARSCLPARGADSAEDHLDSAPAGATASGEDPLKQEGSPVPVPVTVQPSASRFTMRVVRT